jgi:hypothetical protein
MTDPSPEVTESLIAEAEKARQRTEHDVYMLGLVMRDLWLDQSDPLARRTLVEHRSELHKLFGRFSALIDRIDFLAQEILFANQAERDEPQS